MIPVVMRLSMLVGFHPQNVCCDGCRFLADDTSCRGRKKCLLTEEIIYQTKQMGLRCPLEEDDGEQEP